MVIFIKNLEYYIICRYYTEIGIISQSNFVTINLSSINLVPKIVTQVIVARLIYQYVVIYNQTNGEVIIMFDTKLIATRIKDLRISRNMTQMNVPNYIHF
jgi:uncharacterized protein involved in tellurium resistance